MIFNSSASFDVTNNPPFCYNLAHFVYIFHSKKFFQTCQHHRGNVWGQSLKGNTPTLRWTLELLRSAVILTSVKDFGNVHQTIFAHRAIVCQHHSRTRHHFEFLVHYFHLRRTKYRSRIRNFHNTVVLFHFHDLARNFGCLHSGLRLYTLVCNIHRNGNRGRTCLMMI